MITVVCNCAWLIVEKTTAVQCVSLQMLVAFTVIYTSSHTPLIHWKKVIWELLLIHSHNTRPCEAHAWPRISKSYALTMQVFLAQVNNWVVSLLKFFSNLLFLNHYACFLWMSEGSVSQDQAEHSARTGHPALLQISSHSTQNVEHNEISSAVHDCSVHTSYETPPPFLFKTF